ncbi:MAG: metal ABC transporter permease, partial [Cohaesibacter sp.]|nr:metal ABC transporter permease [Cohaesibacter sp.]
MQTLHSLWPYIWPSDRKDLKRRVGYAMVALLFGKLANVFTPYFFKWATDALADPAAVDGIGPVGWLSV